jgi:hypothetical protein
MTGHYGQFAFLISLLAGCGTDPDVFQIGCQGQDVAVHVGTGLTPTIDWAPGCEVGALDVAEYPEASDGGTRVPGATVWAIRSPGNAQGPNNLLTPRVHYGVTPSGASVPTPPQALQAGAPYLIVLSVYSLEGGFFPERLSGVAFQEFRP